MRSSAAVFFVVLGLVIRTVAPSAPFRIPIVKDNMIPRTFEPFPSLRIVNGDLSKPYTRPYQASLQVSFNNRLYHLCGAVVIGRDLLVSAAHCLGVFPVEWLRIEVGSISLASNATVYSQVLEVGAVKPHEQFTGDETQGYAYDIGLIRLKKRMTYNKAVQPVKIAPPGKTFDDQICVISGWGRTSFNSPTPTELREAKVLKWTYRFCYNFHQTFNVSIDKNHVCVGGLSRVVYRTDDVNVKCFCGYGRRVCHVVSTKTTAFTIPQLMSGDDETPAGACSGDSGGPLVCGSQKRYLLGVSSYGFEKCNATATAGSIPVKAYLPAEQEPELERTFVEGPGSRIVNGVPSQLFSRPYQASLQVFYRNAWYHNCGAVIIARDLLVTAAHCLMRFPPNQMRLEVGSMDLTAPVLEYTQFLNISAVKLHEDFLIDESVGFPNDIGLIFLSTPITYNENVQPIKIAPPGLSFDNKICVISGWGRIYGGGPVSPVLLQANMRKWTYEQCYAVNKESNMIINRNHVCVKGESDDGHAPGGCNGDSGGPLTCKHKNKLYLLGVTSYGWDPCDTNYPSVYTRVPGYKNLFDCQTENY